jgi:sec-independent protein translocase protein TatA
MPGFIGLPELLLLGLVVLLVFGPKRLPEMGRSMGRGMREFKDSITGDNKDEISQFVIPAEETGVPSTLVTTEPVALVTAEPAKVVSTEPAERAHKVA